MFNCCVEMNGFLQSYEAAVFMLKPLLPQPT